MGCGLRETKKKTANQEISSWLATVGSDTLFSTVTRRLCISLRFRVPRPQNHSPFRDETNRCAVRSNADTFPGIA